MTDSAIQQQARLILDRLAFTLFDLCQLMSRDFEDVPARPGLYAFRLDFRQIRRYHMS